MINANMYIELESSFTNITYKKNLEEKKAQALGIIIIMVFLNP